MTTPSTARKAGPLLGNGSTTAFPFTFKVFAAADVAVSVTNAAGAITVLTLGTDYTVTLNSNQDTSPGGTINYPVSGAALPTGSAIAIIGDLDYDQVLDLPSGGNFSPLALENQLDRATMQIQQLKELSDRSARMSVFSSPEDVEALTSGIVVLAEIDTEIAAVAANEANVNIVADNISDVNAVGGNITNVVAAGANATNIDAVVANEANINTVAANIGSVNTVAGNVSLMNTVVDNLSLWRDVTAGDDIQVTNFNGTGSQTAFTLPFSPGVENNTQVFIAGVYQQKTEYTVSGTTLTFSSAPPSGTANIEVVWSRPFVLGATSAALVTYQPEGAGAVERTAQAKLREFVSVKDFGAVGDGATDDTAAIQAAINSLPLHTANAGIMTPDGFANGGEIFIPRGRYKVTSTLNLRRGVKLRGESRESSQIVSFTAGSVIQYQDAGRAYPDEIVVSSLSIWQDSSVAATSGAGIDAIDGPSTVQAVFLRVDDVLVKGTYHGIRMSAAIGCGVRDSMISNTVSHGVTVPTGVGFTQSTSIVFENVYSQQSQTGSGFFLQSTAYTNFISCAADGNARYGYEFSGTIAVSIFSGAEANTLGGVLLSQCRGTQCFVNVVDTATANSNAVTLNQSSATVIGGVHSSGAGATGYSIYNIASGTAATFSAGLIRTGGWNNVAQRSNASNLLELNLLNGFTGGITRQYAFGSQPLNSIQLYNSGVSDGSVANGFVTDVELATTGTVSSAAVVRAKTQNVAVTWPVLNGLYVQAPVKGAASTTTRYNGLLIDESSIGSNANTNLAIGASSPPAGNWNIYSPSIRPNYLKGQLTWAPPASATPSNNGDLTVIAVSNTQLRFSYKGSDGVVRSADLTLA